MRSIKLGAPSLTGKGASELVNEAFGDLDFPVAVKVTNLVAHSLSFPEVHGLHLESCVNEGKNSVLAEIDSLPALHRLASSIEQVAELNHHKEMIVIDADFGVVIEPEVEVADKQVDLVKPVISSKKKGR